MARVKTPVDSGPVEAFCRRVRQANAAGSKDVRLSMQEATDLAASLAAVLARLAALEAGRSPVGDGPVVIDGGVGC